MNSIIQNANQVLQSALEETSNFDETTWALLAISTLAIGFFLLKGGQRQ
ncbi:MAG: hypothetical protein AAGA30_04680 [Planctomycetota bacterium]